MVGKEGEVGLEEIKKKFKELVEKRSWVHKQFRELMREFAIVFSVKSDNNVVLEKSIKVKYFEHNYESDYTVWRKEYYFIVEPYLDIAIKVRDYEVGDEESATWMTIFKVDNSTKTPRITYDVITVNEIREFANAFTTIINKLKDEITKRSDEYDAIVTKLEKIKKTIENT